MIRIACSCGNVAEVDETQAGRKGTCRSCGMIIQIPFVRAVPQLPARQQGRRARFAPEVLAAFAVGVVTGALAAGAVALLL
jgi:hypothetical protein